MLNETDNLNLQPNLLQSSGMPAAISDVTADSCTLADLMKNTVVVFESTILVQPPVSITNPVIRNPFVSR